MAVNRMIDSLSFPAGADLSAAQYKIVWMENDGQVNLATDANSPPVGVLTNKPGAADRGAEVAIIGSECKVIVNSAVVTGDLICAAAGGFGSAIAGGTAAGTAYVLGICTQAGGGSGVYAGVLINPFKYMHA